MKCSRRLSYRLTRTLEENRKVVIAGHGVYSGTEITELSTDASEKKRSSASEVEEIILVRTGGAHGGGKRFRSNKKRYGQLS